MLPALTEPESDKEKSGTVRPSVFGKSRNLIRSNFLLASRGITAVLPSAAVWTISPVCSSGNERENAAIGVFITLEKSSSQMETEAADAGFYQTFAGAVKYPKIQILTIEELLHGAEIKMPPRLHQNFKAAQSVPKKVKQVQTSLFDEQ